MQLRCGLCSNLGGHSTKARVKLKYTVGQKLKVRQTCRPALIFIEKFFLLIEKLILMDPNKFYFHLHVEQVVRLQLVIIFPID